jgi:hypothetical protein
MKNTIQTLTPSEYLNSNPLQNFNLPNCDASDIATELFLELFNAIAKNIPADEQMRLSQPENKEEMFSAIRSLPEFKASKKRFYKSLKKRTYAAMDSVVNSNPGCHSTQ